MKRIYLSMLASCCTWSMYSNEYDIESFNERCRALDLELVAIRTDMGEPEAHSTYRGTDFVVPKNLFETLYHDLMDHDPFHNVVAAVRKFKQGTTVGQAEKIAAVNRDAFCKTHLETLLGKALDKHKTPRIALCLSGGGIRATLASAGFLYGCSKHGLLHNIHTISGLSGGTWPLVAWMQSGKPFQEFYTTLVSRVVNGFFNISSSEALSAFAEAIPDLTEYFIKKFIFKEIPSIIDFYGYCLATNLMDQDKMGDYAHDSLAAHQQQSDNGQFPIPLYTAVIPQKNSGEHLWVTFSPYEVSCDALHAAVPARFFGRAFNKGVSVNSAPPLPLGFLMGVWGSAISISFKEFYNMILDSMQPQALFAPLKILAQETSMGDLRFFPASVHNYTYGALELPCSEESYLTLIDAGLVCNLPVPPLLNPERAFDIIIIVDASANIQGAPELKLAEQYAKRHQLPFPSIDYSNIDQQTYSIFDDGPLSQAPVVIYVPMIKNVRYKELFDPQNYLQTHGFMNTFNFDYTPEQAELLTGLFEHVAHEIKDDLASLISKVVDRK